MAQFSFDRLQGEYAQLWATMRVLKTKEASSQARRIIAFKERYKSVEARTKVPWFVIGCLHMRESGGNFHTWLHNGDPMTSRDGAPRRTVQVPKGRPPNPACTWEDGAYDALVTCERLNEVPEWNPARVAYAAELFNGFGYRNPRRNIPSPYLWGGTSVQKTGKFVRDGVYDSTVMDPQIGAMAVLQLLMSLDPEARFTHEDEVPDKDPEQVPEAAPSSPKAQDDEKNVKPLSHSKTLWGNLGSWLTSLGAILTGFWDKIQTPQGLTVTLVLLALVSFFAYMILKGRLDVQNVLKYISPDEEPQ